LSSSLLLNSAKRAKPKGVAVSAKLGW
jgi:hypothetical protein